MQILILPDTYVNLDSTGHIQINELEELRNDAYENLKFHKDKIKDFHDKKIQRKIFDTG